ncbi:MAG: SlyX family protein [Desulfuromonas sp.]|nr:SlyX family protein [Desulfuromonas sp.]
MSEQHLIELESRIAFHEHSIQQLQDLVATQQKQLYDLEEAIKAMARRISQAATGNETSGMGNADQERPPHY